MKKFFNDENTLIAFLIIVIFFSLAVGAHALNALTIFLLAIYLAVFITWKINMYLWRKQDREWERKREAEDREREAKNSKWEREREEDNRKWAAKKREWAREREEDNRKWAAQTREFRKEMIRLLDEKYPPKTPN